jgi:hypothetical protein
MQEEHEAYHDNRVAGHKVKEAESAGEDLPGDLREKRGWKNGRASGNSTGLTIAHPDAQKKIEGRRCQLQSVRIRVQMAQCTSNESGD